MLFWRQPDGYTLAVTTSSVEVKLIFNENELLCLSPLSCASPECQQREYGLYSITGWTYETIHAHLYLRAVSAAGAKLNYNIEDPDLSGLCEVTVNLILVLQALFAKQEKFPLHPIALVAAQN